MHHDVPPLPLPRQARLDPGEGLTRARLPRITLSAHCEADSTRQALDRACDDRRMAQVRARIEGGGIDGAVRAYRTAPTPDLLVVESSAAPDAMLAQLDELAQVCDPRTQVIVIAPCNDITFYRRLKARGIEEYLVGPVGPLAFIATLQGLYSEGRPDLAGKVYAVVGAKGGVGASMIAQDTAQTIAEDMQRPTLLVDLDFRFGSAALNLDLKPTRGLENYLGDEQILDRALLDRLVAPRGACLSVLTSPGEPLSDASISDGAISRLISVARQSFAFTVLDLPHEWTPASRETLADADEVIVVASPDLANLRNSKYLVERLRGLRPNDGPPKLILNGCAMRGRREIAPARFARAVGVSSASVLRHDPALFCGAAADGRTIREQGPRSAAQKTVRDIVRSLAGEPATAAGLLSRLKAWRPSLRPRRRTAV